MQKVHEFIGEVVCKDGWQPIETRMGSYVRFYPDRGLIFSNARSNAPSDLSQPSFRAVSGTARIALFALASYVLVLALCRRLPCGRSLISRSIGEALPDDALQRTFGALCIIYAKPDAIAIAEVELRKIAVQMLLASNADRCPSCRV